ncbi:invasion associated locus B family protein [Pelagibacterium limicola]|uniref:invasion associated locus B family protein n=1 Tax=Pelagibacterium limicola TaxID=2791022 RepID=UPI0018AFEEDF|nr:invasion associated locus B family protein [Pelagibacterium limicola]
MTAKHVFLAGLVAVGLSMGGMPAAFGQEAGMIDEVVESQERRPEDNWLKVCSDLDDGRKACIMRQVVTNTGVFVGSFLLRDDPSQESRLLAVASVPLGVLLPFGLSWQIDGGKPVRVPYMLCDPQACSAQLVVNEAYVQSLKRGGTLKLIAKNRLNEDVTVEVTLSGFTAVYDNPEGLDINELNRASSTENVLEQVLQDRAEQLRQQLEGNATGDAPAAEETPTQ